MATNAPAYGIQHMGGTIRIVEGSNPDDLDRPDFALIGDAHKPGIRERAEKVLRALNSHDVLIAALERAGEDLELEGLETGYVREALNLAQGKA